MTRPLEQSHVSPERVIHQRPRFRRTVKLPGDYYYDSRAREWKVFQPDPQGVSA